MTGPGLRLHPRTMQVQRATAELQMSLLKFQLARKLTDAEMAGILLYAAERVAVRLLRAERHPGDPGRKADEA